MENVITEAIPEPMLQSLRTLDQQANECRQQMNSLIAGYSFAKDWQGHNVNFDIQSGMVTAFKPETASQSVEQDAQPLDTPAAE